LFTEAQLRDIVMRRLEVLETEGSRMDERFMVTEPAHLDEEDIE